MAHKKVYGFCESGCKVEVLPAEQTAPEDIGAAAAIAEEYTTPKAAQRKAHNDLLNVNLSGDWEADIMKPAYFGAENPKDLINTPVTDSPFYGIRNVYRAGNMTIVELLEAHPKRGRRWTRVYDPKYSTWFPEYKWAESSFASDAISKAQITDFPSSMPASDVYPWAKKENKPTYTASEVGALASTGGIVSGPVTFPADGVFIKRRNNHDSSDGGHMIFESGSADDGSNVFVGAYAGGFRAYSTKDGIHGFSLKPDGTFSVEKLEVSGAAKGRQTLKNLGLEIQVGVIEVGTSGAQLTFPEAFSGVPVVTANSSKQTSVRIHSITETGCTLVSGEASSVVQWQAVYIAE